MKGDLEKTLEAGCDAYLSKPVSRQAFIECLRVWLAKPVDEWYPARLARRRAAA